MYLLYHHLIVVEISQFCVINVFSFHDMFLSRMMPDVGLSRYCIFTSLFLSFSPVIWLFAMVSLLYSVIIILTDSVYSFYQLLCSIHICYTTLCLSTTLLVCHIKQHLSLRPLSSGTVSCMIKNLIRMDLNNCLFISAVIILVLEYTYTMV